MATIDRLELKIYFDYARRIRDIENTHRLLNLHQAQSVHPHATVINLSPQKHEIEELFGFRHNVQPWALFSIPNGWVDVHGEMLNEYNSKFDCTIAFFDQGILLYTILLTSIIMTISLIMTRGEKVKDVLLDSIKLKSGDNKVVSKIEEALSDNNQHIDEQQ